MMNKDDHWKLQMLCRKYNKLDERVEALENGSGGGSAAKIGDFLLSMAEQDDTWIEANGFSPDPGQYPVLAGMLRRVDLFSIYTSDYSFLGASQCDDGFVFVGFIAGEGAVIWRTGEKTEQVSDFMDIPQGGGNLNSVAGSFSTNFLIAVGEAGHGKKSTNFSGTAWNPIDIAFGSTAAKFIHYSSTIGFTVVGASGKMTRSADGVTFANVANPFGAGTMYGFAENTDTNDHFVAVGAAGKVMHSTDGVTWANVISGVAVDLFCVFYWNGTFYAAGSGGAMIRSEDGVLWTSYNNPVFGANTIYTITEANGVLFAGGQRGIVASSTDGINWEEEAFPDDGYDFRGSAFNKFAGTRGTIGVAGTATPNLPDEGPAKWYIKAKLS